MRAPERRAERSLSTRLSRRDLLRGIAGLGLSVPGLNLLAGCDDAGQTEENNGDGVSGDGATGTIQLTGSGASFPDPIYQVWIAEYESMHSDVQFNYQAVGSGQGKRNFINNVTDFAASDAYLTEEELEQVPDALHIPTVIGAVAVTYHLEDVGGLRLSGETLASIYLGEITEWNHPRIQEENPDIDLPDQDIAVIFRSDGSGTTWIFTDFLAKVSDAWSERVGTGTSVRWPVGIGGEKNAGVMATVEQTPGAIGYVEFAYAFQLGWPAMAIRNQQGNFAEPTLENVQQAAAGYIDEMPDDLRISITNPPEGENSYPISGMTWLLLREERSNREETAVLIDFIYWALTEGDELARDLHYAPIPEVVQEMAIDKLEQITVNEEQIFERPPE